MRLWGWCLVAGAVAIVVGPAAGKTTIKASTVYEGGDASYTAEMAFDGLLDTSWSEGQAGAGVDEWVEIDFGETRAIHRVSIWGGEFSEGSKKFSERNRLKTAHIVVSNDEGEKTYKVEFGDRYTRHDFPISTNARKVRVIIKDTYSGAIFDNTHIAEIAFDYPDKFGGDLPKWDKWWDSKDSEERETAFEEALNAAYEQCKASEDYSNQFRFIARAAVHGPDYLHEKVAELVPAGWRGAYLPIDTDAVEYLQRLKDVNAIPYLEAAASRATGDDQFWLEDLVKAFRAHEELISSRRMSIPNWGTTGLEPGALNGHGEPLSIDVNTSNRIYVADVGNNRVQWFTPDGRMEGMFGGEPGVAWEWFGSEGDPYATGAAPGDGPGQFKQPLYVAVGNYDIVAVIDASKRVQTFDEEGNPIGDWVIPSDEYIGYGRGCATPIISWWGDEFFFMIGKEVWVYTAHGQMLRKFALPEEILAGVVADGKLLIRHAERDIVEYAIQDGFRQGSWPRKPIPEDGSEDWDLATDAEDNLYVATDAGVVYIYNKKGKFSRKVEMFANPKNLMRICVSPDMSTLYVTAQDQIHRVDLGQ